MEKGWKATGLLKPLWKRVGGRDALAELTGIGGGTLSQYNSGKRRLGQTNAEKIARALKVSLLELGAPEDLADRRGQTILRHLEELQATVARLVTQNQRLARRVSVLERRSPDGSARAKGSGAK